MFEFKRASPFAEYIHLSDKNLFQDPTVIPHLINILSKSFCTQECITTIFSNCCKVSQDKFHRLSFGAIFM